MEKIIRARKQPEQLKYGGTDPDKADGRRPETSVLPHQDPIKRRVLIQK